MSFSRESMINQLKGVLPYTDSWYSGLADKRLRAIHSANLSKIVERALLRDENEVRAKVGLDPIVPKSNQLTLF